MVVLGQLLVDEGLVMPEGVERALDRQRRHGGHLGTNLLEEGLIEEEPLLSVLGRQRHAPTVSARDLASIPSDVLHLLPADLAVRHRVVPFRRRGQTLYLASISPGEINVEDEISQQTSCLTRTCIGLELRVREALDRYYGVPRDDRLVRLAERLRPHPPHRTRPLVGNDRPLSFDDLRLDSLFVVPPEEQRPRGPLLPLRPAPTASRSLAAAAGAESSPAGPSIPAVASTPPPEPLAQGASAPVVFHSPPLPPDPATLLRRATEELERPQDREQVVDVLLRLCAPYFRRRVIIVRRGDRLTGWRGEAPDLDRARIVAISLDGRAPSVFFSIAKGAKFWLGPLPRLAVHEQLVDALGGDAPAECLVLPIVLRHRVQAFLYADNLSRSGRARPPLAELRRLVAKVGLAFEVCILQAKIKRT